MIGEVSSAGSLGDVKKSEAADRAQEKKEQGKASQELAAEKREARAPEQSGNRLNEVA